MTTAEVFTMLATSLQSGPSRLWLVMNRDQALRVRMRACHRNAKRDRNMILAKRALGGRAGYRVDMAQLTKCRLPIPWASLCWSCASSGSAGD